MATFYITKYALSSGVVKAEADELGNGMIVVRPDRSKSWAGDAYYHGEGRDWCRTPEAAAACVEKKRLAKIASFRKAIAKLEKPIAIPTA